MQGLEEPSDGTMSTVIETERRKDWSLRNEGEEGEYRVTKWWDYMVHVMGDEIVKKERWDTGGTEDTIIINYG